MLTATPLKSTMLNCASYESKTQTLVLEYNKGNDLWYYSKVPFHVFEGLLAAESTGKYFLAEIKGKYEGRKVAPGTPFTARFEMPLTEEIDMPDVTPETPPYPTQLPDQNAERPW